jgi:hypothetical protein
MSDATLVHQTAQTNALPVSVGEVPQTRPWLDREIGDPEMGENPALVGHAFQQVKVTRPGDAFEQEAERSADAAVGPAAPVRRSTQMPQVTPDLVNQIDSAGAEGKNLPDKQRGFFEERLGHDFGSVRVHTGPRAADAAQDLNAEAFTRGQNVYFGAGYYQPDTPAGQRLMAHELAHTLQPRPGVIARQAVADAGVAEAAVAEPVDSQPPDESQADTQTAETVQSSDSIAQEIRMYLDSDPSDSSGQARRRIAQLPPDQRAPVVAALRVDIPLASRGQIARVLPSPRPAARPEERVGSPASSSQPGRSAQPREQQQSRVVNQASQTAAASVPALTPQPPNRSAATSRTLPATVPGVPASIQRPAATPRAPHQPTSAPSVLSAESVGTGGHSSAGAGGSVPVMANASAGGPAGAATAETSAPQDDNQPLRLADLLEEPSPTASLAQANPVAGRTAGENVTNSSPSFGEVDTAQIDTGETPTPDERDPAEAIPSPEESAAQMDVFAVQLESTLAQSRDTLNTQSETVRNSIRQKAAASRAGIRAEVERTVRSIQSGSTELLGWLSTSVSAAHAQIDTSKTARRAEADQKGTTSQDNIRGIFGDHRSNVQRIVSDNVAAAELLRTQKAQSARTRNQNDAETAMTRGRAKWRSYGNSERGNYIGYAAYQIAEGTAQKMGEQEPDIISAVDELTAPLPEHFRSQGAEALNGFDEHLPEILVSVGTGVSQTQADINQRTGEAHSQLTQFAAQTQTEITQHAQESIQQANELTPQLESQLDQELNRSLRAVAAAPREVIERISPPIEEAIAMFRSGADNPDVDAARQLTEALNGFINDSTAQASATLEQASTAGEQRFQEMRDGARQIMRTHLTRVQAVWQGSQTGISTALTQMVNGIDEGFGGTVTALQDVLTETEQSIRNQLSPIIGQLDGSFRDVLRDTERDIDSHINEGLAKNTEALDQLNDKMEEAVDDAAFEYDHPVLATLSFIAGIIVGIVSVLLVVVALIAVTALIGAVLGVGMLAAGLILMAGMAAFSIGFAFGARLAAGQSFGQALGGAFVDFGRSVPGMLYDMTGIPKLRRAFSGERMSMYQRGRLVGEGGTEFVLAIFMVRGAAQGIARGFRSLPRFRPPVVEPTVRPVALPETPPAAPSIPESPIRAPRIEAPARPAVPEAAPRTPRIPESAPRPSIPETTPRPTVPESTPRPTVSDAAPRPPSPVVESAPRPAAPESVPGEAPASPNRGRVTRPEPLQGQGYTRQPGAPGEGDVIRPDRFSRQPTRPAAPEVPEAAPNETSSTPERPQVSQPGVRKGQGYSREAGAPGEGDVIRPDRFSRQPGQPQAPEVPEGVPQETTPSAQQRTVRRPGANRGTGYSRESGTPGEGDVIRPDRLRGEPSTPEVAPEAQPQRAARAAGAEGDEPFIGEQSNQPELQTAEAGGNRPGGSNPVQAEAARTPGQGRGTPRPARGSTSPARGSRGPSRTGMSGSGATSSAGAGSSSAQRPIPGDANYTSRLPTRSWRLAPEGDGAHLVERSNVAGRPRLGAFDQPETPRFYPEGNPRNAGQAHIRLHRATRQAGIRLGGNRRLNNTQLLEAYRRAYSDPSLDGIRGDLRTPDGSTVIARNVTPLEALEALLEWGGYE